MLARNSDLPPFVEPVAKVVPTRFLGRADVVVTDVRVGSKAPVHEGRRLRPDIGVKRTFLTECPQLGLNQTCRGRGWNGES